MVAIREFIFNTLLSLAISGAIGLVKCENWDLTTESQTTTNEPELKTFVCRVDDTGYCIFENVYLSTEAYRFVPIAENISATLVKKVIFIDSDMEVFGPDICMTFPNLEILGIDNCNIKDFASSALLECKNLLTLSARGNRLEKLTAETLKGIENVRHLKLMDNNIAHIDDNTFYALESLVILELHNNKLNEFSTAIAAKMCTVRELRLDSNELFDIDVETLLGSSFGKICLTNLLSLGIDDNNINCHRISSIVKSFQSAGITPPKAFLYKHRSFSTKIVSGFKCLGETEWAALFAQKTNLVILNEIKRMVNNEL